jgi:signal peptidase I
VFGAKPRRTTLRVLVMLAVAFVTLRWILIPIRAEGISMRPTYEPGTLHFVNRLAFLGRSPARGEVVAIRLAGPHVVYVKRIVGLPGERLAIVRGEVFVNGVPLEEPYVKLRRPWEVADLTLAPGEYFVVGDNRGMDAGEHDFGRTDASRIVGKVLF